jgi:hypothetical protein
MASSAALAQPGRKAVGCCQCNARASRYRGRRVAVTYGLDDALRQLGDCNVRTLRWYEAGGERVVLHPGCAGPSACSQRRPL